MINSISLLIIGHLRLYISSWFNFSNLCLSKSFSFSLNSLIFWCQLLIVSPYNPGYFCKIVFDVHPPSLIPDFSHLHLLTFYCQVSESSICFIDLNKDQLVLIHAHYYHLFLCFSDSYFPCNEKPELTLFTECSLGDLCNSVH